MSFNLYSQSVVDIVFGEGPLGFIIGKNEDDFSMLKGFDTKEDGTRLPLEGCGAVHKGDFIIAVNGEPVTFLGPRDVKGKLKKSPRPLTVRFAHHCSKEDYKTITSPEGEKKTQKWRDDDVFLPVRTYRLSGMNDNFITLRSTDNLEEKALTPIYHNGTLFECDVREAAYNGLSTQQTRANVWKMLLHSYPFQPSKWEDKRKENFDTYQTFVNEFITSRNAACGKENCDLVPNPMDSSWKRSADYNPADDDGETNESKWSREFGETDMREIIWKDTLRTYSDIPFYSDYNREVIARMLFVFGKLNVGVRYVQGMNELIAPLLYVFAESEMDSMEKEVSREVEADTFFTFNNLMSETKDLFIQQMDSSTSGMRGVLEELHGYLNRHVVKASNHLDSLQVDTQFYAVRWLTTLFAREFSMPDTFRLWDALLADPMRFMFMHCIGAAMVELVEDSLLQADFAGIMGILQQYQPPAIHDLFTAADAIRMKQLKPVKEEEEERKGVDLKKMAERSAELAGEMGDQVKKGWNIVKTKGLPFLSKIAQDTKSKVASMSEQVNQKLKEKMKEREEQGEEEKEEEESEEEERGEGKKGKKGKKSQQVEKKKEKKTLTRKGSVQLSESEESSSEEEDKKKKKKDKKKKENKKKTLKKQRETSEDSDTSEKEEEEEEEEDNEVAYL